LQTQQTQRLKHGSATSLLQGLLHADSLENGMPQTLVLAMQLLALSGTHCRFSKISKTMHMLGMLLSCC